MDIDEILKELKKELTYLFKETFKDFIKESKEDLNSFLVQSENKLKRWTMLLSQGVITQDEFAWLISSQKDLMHFHALYATGVSKIKLGHFKNKVIDTIIVVIFRLV